MLTPFMALLLLQQDQTAFRTEKADYIPAIARCKEGEGNIESDPRAAIDSFDAVLNNSKIRKVECRLRVEERPSEYSAWYLFLPNQYRGRAKINLAKKADPTLAERLLNEAMADLQKSVDSGVASSGNFLNTAREELAKVKAVLAKPPPGTGPAVVVKEDPLVKFRPRWQEMLFERKFKSARAYLDAEGKELTDPQKKTLTDEVERECRTFLNTEVARFRRNLTGLRSEEDLQAMTDGDFTDSFVLPSPNELVIASPVIEWARINLPALRDVQSKKIRGSGLLGAAAACVPLEEKGENVWFKALENVAFQSMEDQITKIIESALDSAKADRDKARAQAEALQAPWKQFAAKLDPKFRQAHRVDEHGLALAKIFERFPSELAELAKVDVDACFAASAPEAELAKLEQSLRGLEGRKGVTRESRQALYTLLVHVGSLKALFSGKTEDEAAGELVSYGAKLKEVGGASGTDKYGPRVAKVFQSLLK